MKNCIIYIIFLWPFSFCAQDQTVGLFLNTEEAYNGYTLLSNNDFTYLIDNCGFIVNQWESEYKAGQSYYLYPNGDLLRAGFVSGDFNVGGRGGVFEIYDWNGNLKWQYFISNNAQHAHHDLSILPNGNFICLVWEKRSKSETIAKGSIEEIELWSEVILEIQPKGNSDADIVWKWSLWDHLIQDFDKNLDNYGNIETHPELIDINFESFSSNRSDRWHFNSIDYNPSLDQILVGSRNLSEFYILDHSTSTEEASSSSGGRYGKGGDILYRYGNPQVCQQGTASDQVLFRQHDVQWTFFDKNELHNFSVFNNEFSPGQYSSIEIVKNPSDINGVYTFTNATEFNEDFILRSYQSDNVYSDILSGAQYLPNGNLLITEGAKGHIFEIDQEDNFVWDYIYPVNRNGGPSIQGGNIQFNTLFKAVKYSPDFPGFVDKQLTPIKPIELLPLDNDCQVYETIVSTTPLSLSIPIFTIAENPVYSKLKITCQSNCEIFLINMSGLSLNRYSCSKGVNEFNIEHLPSGIYWLRSSQGLTKFIKI